MIGLTKRKYIQNQVFVDNNPNHPKNIKQNKQERKNIKIHLKLNRLFRDQNDPGKHKITIIKLHFHERSHKTAIKRQDDQNLEDFEELEHFHYKKVK